jgi:general secretion pathway protein L
MSGAAMTAAELVADWKKELGALACRQLGDAWNDAGTLTLAVSGSEAELTFRRGNQETSFGCVTIDQQDASQKVRELLAKAGIRRRDVALLLSADDVLRPSVRLPRTSRQTLRRALGYEIERLSPISPDEVYFDFAATAGDSSASTVQVDLRIIRRDLVDPAIALCHASGLGVGAILFEGEARPADWRAFPVDRGALLCSEARRLGPALLGAAAIFLLIAILIAAYLRGAALADDLADQVSSEALRAAQVESLRHRIDRTVTQFAFLEKQKRAPLFVSVLNDVTRTLPDGTWITEFDLSGNRIRIEGYSRSAADLVAIFDRSGRFTNAQFAAPVTQGGSPALERFDLTFELVGGTI